MPFAGGKGDPSAIHAKLASNLLVSFIFSSSEHYSVNEQAYC